MRKIAELFYPKELKDIIADLRAKDDLNEEVLNHLNTFINYYFIFWIFILILFAGISKSLVAFLILFLLATFLLSILYIVDIRRAGKKSIVYQKGKLREGAIIKIIYGYKLSTISLTIQDALNNTLIKVDPISLKLFKQQTLTEGDPMCFFSLGKRSDENMPDYPPIKWKYCLSLSMLKGIA